VNGQSVSGAKNMSPASYPPLKTTAAAVAGQPDTGDVPAAGFQYGH